MSNHKWKAVQIEITMDKQLKDLTGQPSLNKALKSLINVYKLSDKKMLNEKFIDDTFRSLQSVFQDKQRILVYIKLLTKLVLTELDMTKTEINEFAGEIDSLCNKWFNGFKSKETNKD